MSISEVVKIRISETAGLDRVNEPVTMGIPCPKSFLTDVLGLCLEDPDSGCSPLQTRTLAVWPDQSVKWLLLDFQVSLKANSFKTLNLIYSDAAHAVRDFLPVSVEETGLGINIDTGNAVFLMSNEIFRPFEQILVNKTAMLQEGGTKIALMDEDHRELLPYISRISFPTRGALRTTLNVEGAFGKNRRNPVVSYFAYLHFYSGSSLVKLDFTLVNHKAAVHEGGLWDLGNAGSFLFRDLSLHLPLNSTEPSAALRLMTEDAERKLQLTGAEVKLSDLTTDKLTVYQDSSGGDNWRCGNHVNAKGQVRNTFRGYRISRGADILKEGTRAQPTLYMSGNNKSLAATVRYFWQNFPKALEAEQNRIIIRIFPEYHDDVFELQGGEQKTHELFFSVDSGSRTFRDLRWVQHALVPTVEASWYAGCQVFPDMFPAVRSRVRN